MPASSGAICDPSGRRRRAPRWRGFRSTGCSRCAREAAEHFLNDTLPLGDAQQSPDDYVLQLSATTGMPHVLVRRNMQQDRRRDARDAHRAARPHARPRLSLLDAGHGEHGGHALSFYPRTACARRRAAEQFAGRALAVGAGDSR